MPELVATLTAKQEEDYQHKRFLAAMQGVDLDQNNNQGEDVWQKALAKAHSNGATNDINDIVSLQGGAAEIAGFGIGVGLDYEVA